MVTPEDLTNDPFTLVVAKEPAQITRTVSGLLRWCKEKNKSCLVLNFNAAHQWDDALQRIQPNQGNIEITDGPLLNLLIHTNGERLLVIDCHDSQAKLVESLNALFDDKPYLQISPTQQKHLDLAKARIVLLVTQQDLQDGKFSEAFYSRLSHIQLSQHDFAQASPSQMYWPEKQVAATPYKRQNNDVTVDLGHDPDWQTPLWGRFVSTNAQWSVEAGGLQKAVEQKKPVQCVLVNTPSPLPKDLRYLIDRAQTQPIDVYGEVLDLGQITFVDGGQQQPDKPPKAKVYQYRDHLNKPLFPVNSVTVEALFQTIYLDENRHLTSKQGLLDNSLKRNLLISGRLLRAQWHRLCQRAAGYTLYLGKGVTWPKAFLGSPPKKSAVVAQTRTLVWSDMNSLERLRKDKYNTGVFYCHDLGLGTTLLHAYAEKIGAKINWIYTVNEDKDDGQLLSRYDAQPQDKVKEAVKNDEKSNVDQAPAIWVPQQFEPVEGPLLKQLLTEDQKGILLLKAADLAPGLLEHLEVVLHLGQVLVAGQLQPVKRRLWLLFEDHVTHPALQHAPSRYRLQVDQPRQVYPQLLRGSHRDTQIADTTLKLLLDLVTQLNDQVPQHTRLKTPLHLSWQRLHALYNELAGLSHTQDVHEVVDRLVWGHFYGQDPEARAYAGVLLRAGLASRDTGYTVDITVLEQAVENCADLSRFRGVFWRLLSSLNGACLRALGLEKAPFQGAGLSRPRQYLRALLSRFNGKDFSTRTPGLSTPLATLCRRYALACGVTDWPLMSSQVVDEKEEEKDDDKHNIDVIVDTPSGSYLPPRVTVSHPSHAWTRQTDEALQLIRRYPAVALLGPAGTGKSHFLRKLQTFANSAPDQNNKNKTPMTVQLFGPLNISPHTHTGSPDFNAVVGRWLDQKSAPNTWFVLALDEANLRDQRLWNLWRDLSQAQPVVWWRGKSHPLSPGHKIVVTGNPPDYVGRLQGWVMRDLFFTVHFHPFDRAYLKQAILPKLLEHYGMDQSHLAALSDNLAVGISACRVLRPRQQMSIRDIQSILQSCVAIDPTFKNPKEVLYQAWVRAVFAGFSRDERQALMTWYRQRYFQAYDLVTAPIHQGLPFAAEAKRVLQGLPKTITVTPLTQAYVQQVIACVKDIEYFVEHQDKNKNKNKDGTLIGKVMTIFEGPSGIGKDLVLPQVLKHYHYQPLDQTPATIKTHRHYVHLTASTLEKLVKVIEDAKTKGYVVIVSEINLLPSAELEGALNDTLAGAAAPGFYLFITMNSSRLSGRQTLSRAFMNRGVVCQLRSYNRHELLQIVQNHKDGQTLNQNIPLYLVGLHQSLRSALEKYPRAPLPTLRDLLKCVHTVIVHKKAKSANPKKDILPLFLQSYRLFYSFGQISELVPYKVPETDTLPVLSLLVQLYSRGYCRQVSRPQTVPAIGSYTRQHGVRLGQYTQHDVPVICFQGHLAYNEGTLPLSNNPYLLPVLQAWRLGQQPVLASRYKALNRHWGTPTEILKRLQSTPDNRGDEKEKKVRMPPVSPAGFGQLLCGMVLNPAAEHNLATLITSQTLPYDWVNCLRQVHLTYHTFKAAQTMLTKPGRVGDALVLAFLHRWAELTQAYFDEYAWNKDKPKQQAYKFSAFNQQYQYAVGWAKQAPLTPKAQRGIEGCVYLDFQRMQVLTPQQYTNWWQQFEPSEVYQVPHHKNIKPQKSVDKNVKLFGKQWMDIFKLWLNMQFGQSTAANLKYTLNPKGDQDDPDLIPRLTYFNRLLTEGRSQNAVFRPRFSPQTLIPGMNYARESRRLFLYSTHNPEWCAHLLLATATGRWSYPLPKQTDLYRRRLRETLYYLIYNRQLAQSYPGFAWHLNSSGQKTKHPYNADLTVRGLQCRYWQQEVEKLLNKKPKYTEVTNDVLIYWMIKRSSKVNKSDRQSQRYVQEKISFEDTTLALTAAWVYGYISYAEIVNAYAGNKWWQNLLQVTSVFFDIESKLHKFNNLAFIEPQQIVEAIDEIKVTVELICKKSRPTQTTSLKLGGSNLSGVPRASKHLATQVRGIKYLATGIIDQCDEYGVPLTSRKLTVEDYISAGNPKALNQIGSITALPFDIVKNEASFKLLVPLGCAIQNPSALHQTMDLTKLIGPDGLVTFKLPGGIRQFSYNVLFPKKKPLKEAPLVVKCTHKKTFKIDTNTKNGKTLNKIVSERLPEDGKKLGRNDVYLIEGLTRWIAKKGTYSGSDDTRAQWQGWRNKNKEKEHMLNFCLRIEFKGVCHEFNSMLFAILWSLKHYNNPMRLVDVYLVESGEVYSTGGHIVLQIFIDEQWVTFDATPPDNQTVDHVTIDNRIEFGRAAYPYAPPDRDNPYDTPIKNAEIRNAIKTRFPQLFHTSSERGGVRFAWSGHRINLKQLVRGQPPFAVSNTVTVLQPQNLVITNSKFSYVIAGYDNILSVEYCGRFYRGYAINHLFAQLFNLGFTFTLNTTNDIVEVSDIDQLKDLMYAGHICDISPEQLNMLREKKELTEPYTIVDMNLVAKLVNAFLGNYAFGSYQKNNKEYTYYHLNLNGLSSQHFNVYDGLEKVLSQPIERPSASFWMGRISKGLPDNIFQRLKVTRQLRHVKIIGDKFEGAPVSKTAFKSIPWLESFNLCIGSLQARGHFEALGATSLYSLILDLKGLNKVNELNQFLRQASTLYALGVMCTNIDKPVTIPPNIKYLSIKTFKNIDFRYNKLVTLALKDANVEEIFLSRATFPELVTLSLHEVIWPDVLDPKLWEDFKARCPKLTRFKVVDGPQYKYDQSKNESLLDSDKLRFPGVTHVLYKFSPIRKRQMNGNIKHPLVKLFRQKLQGNNFPDEVHLETHMEW